MGRYFKLFLERFFNLDSNIIIENINIIATAPTYIIINSRPRNSHSSKNNNKEVIIKLNIKNNNEKIEFLDNITTRID